MTDKDEEWAIIRGYFRWSETKLKFWRKLHNMTQKQMADRLGTSRSTYRRFEENLHRKAPRDKGLEIRASELTGIPANKLHYSYDDNTFSNMESARAYVAAEGTVPYTEKTVMSDKEERRRKRRRRRLRNDFWGERRDSVSLLEWHKIELDIVEWAAIFETIRQQRRQHHNKPVSNPSNFESEVKDAIEKRKPLTVLEYNRLGRLWSQQKVAAEIGISQSRYSKIERRKKATDAELDQLEQLFGISKQGLFLPHYLQRTNYYRLRTGGKSKPEGRRRLSFEERGYIFLKRHPNMPWHILLSWLQDYELSPFRAIRLLTREDEGELLFRDR